MQHYCTDMISIQQVNKSFKDKIALDRLSLEIPEGEIFALLGPNGAGKTTTINLLLGFLKPDSGQILVKGVDPFRESSEARKSIAYIPENVNLYPHLSGIENLNYFSQLAGIDLSNTELEHYLSECGLQKEAFSKHTGSYSKGMRQKVGIAIAYAKKASVILMDEPASGLDPVASKELSQLIRKLAAEGSTILMASHDLFRVKETAHRIGILYQGTLLQTIQADAVTANDLEEIYLETVSQTL